MTRLLEKAFEKAATLSPQEQDALADWLLKELESEERWAKLFKNSQDDLSKLGKEALDEHRKGETTDLDISGHRR